MMHYLKPINYWDFDHVDALRPEFRLVKTPNRTAYIKENYVKMKNLLLYCTTS